PPASAADRSPARTSPPPRRCRPQAAPRAPPAAAGLVDRDPARGAACGRQRGGGPGGGAGGGGRRGRGAGGAGGRLPARGGAAGIRFRQGGLDQDGRAGGRRIVAGGVHGGPFVLVGFLSSEPYDTLQGRCKGHTSEQRRAYLGMYGKRAQGWKGMGTKSFPR